MTGTPTRKRRRRSPGPLDALIAEALRGLLARPGILPPPAATVRLRLIAAARKIDSLGSLIAGGAS